MEGTTKAELDKIEKSSLDFPKSKQAIRPRDAATLLLLDRSAPGVRVLMGKRSSRHVFMPGKFVFPGGRTDPADSRVPVASPLHPLEERKLIGTSARATTTRARAIALSAIRETYEEAGILIGRKAGFATAKTDWQGFVEHGVAPSLADIRYVARFITPPGRVRRYDTRFLAIWRDSVALELPDGGPTDELEELAWVSLPDAMSLDIPHPTRVVLGELNTRLETDPELTPGGDVPYYRMLHGRIQKVVL
jgi:8-oxo-dGTP pyrophosphatase MutT (NUDIX family)